MNRPEIDAALEELGSELEKRGIGDARLLLVGGAVMVLEFGAREMTDDVDAGVYPAEAVLEVAAELGKRRGWGPKWLNDAAKIYIPHFKPPDWKSVRKVGTLEIFTADARAMLAMKMRASRGARDEPDLIVLLRMRHYERHGSCFALRGVLPRRPSIRAGCTHDPVRFGATELVDHGGVAGASSQRPHGRHSMGSRRDASMNTGVPSARSRGLGRD